MKRNLLVLVLLTGTLGLLLPRLGQVLSGAVMPLLATVPVGVPMSLVPLATASTAINIASGSTVVGVAVRTWQPRRIHAAPITVVRLTGVALVLNPAGYALAVAGRPVLRRRGERIAVRCGVAQALTAARDDRGAVTTWQRCATATAARR